MIGRLEVLPGPGTAARYGDITVWAGPTATPALLSFLIQSASNLASVPDGGRRIADHLAGVLRQRDPEPSVAFVTVGPGERGPVTLLHGPVQMWDGARWVRPDPGTGWMVTEVPNLTTVLVTPNDTPAPANANPMLDLRSGVVPGGGLAVVMTPDSVVPVETPGAETPGAETPGAETPGAETPGAEGLPVAAGATPDSAATAETPLEATTPQEPAPDAVIPDAVIPGVVTPDVVTPDVVTPDAVTAEGAPAAETSESDPLGPAALAGTVGIVGAAGAGIAAVGHHESQPQVEPDPSTGLTEGATPPTEPEATALLMDTAPLIDTAPPSPEAGAGAEVPAEPPEHPTLPEPVNGPENLVDLPLGSWTPLPPVAAGAPTPAGSPTVPGLRCPNGHFNHPRSTTCSICRLPLDQIHGRTDGPRPVLGVLISTDGSLWRVDGGYVVGTNPAEDAEVAAGRVQALPVPDDGQAQTVHAEVQVHDWAVTVTDRNSRRGTYVLPPGMSDWQKIPPGQPVPVQPGTHVAIGATVFTFTSPWQL